MVHLRPIKRLKGLIVLPFALVYVALTAGPALAKGDLVQVIPDISLLMQMGNFLVAMFLLNLFLFKPIRKILARREAHFSKFRTDIGSLDESTAGRTKELNDLLAAARKQGAKTREELKQEAQAREKDLVEEATAEMEASVAEVREQVRGEIGSAREELRGQVEAFSRQVAEKILGRSL